MDNKVSKLLFVITAFQVIAVVADGPKKIPAKTVSRYLTAPAPHLQGELRDEWIRRVRVLEKEVGIDFNLTQKSIAESSAKRIKKYLVRDAQKVIELAQEDGDADLEKLMKYIKDYAEKNYDELWEQHLKQLKANPPYYRYYAVPELGKVYKVAAGGTAHIEFDERTPLIHVFETQGKSFSKAEIDANLIARLGPDRFFALQRNPEPLKAFRFNIFGTISEKLISPPLSPASSPKSSPPSSPDSLGGANKVKEQHRKTPSPPPDLEASAYTPLLESKHGGSSSPRGRSSVGSWFSSLGSRRSSSGSSGSEKAFPMVAFASDSSDASGSHGDDLGPYNAL